MAESKSKKGSSRISFPQRVYNVLKFTEENNQEHIISWVNNGTAFKVHDLDVFSRDFLPTYFNTHKYASFTRTLCAYGFDCVRTGRQTGIYSHPKFSKNDTAAISQIKRVVKNKGGFAKEAISNLNGSDDGLQALKNRLSSLKYGIQDGDRMIMFPSLLDSASSNEEASSTPFGQLYQTIRSQVVDRTTKALVRLPPGSNLISPFESDDDNSMGRHSPFHATQPSSSFRMSASNTIHQQQQIAQNYGTLLDDHVAPMPLTPRMNFSQDSKPHFAAQTLPQQADGLFESVPWSPQQHDGGYQGGDEDGLGDLEPIPWSPQHYSLQQDKELLSSLEPRSIQNMREHPDNNFNGWYNVTPVVPKPKYQAIYDMASPIALPSLFYYFDISTFGLCWASFLIVGHTIQALYTAFGPNTEHLVWNPKISILKHHFLDIMWVHTLLSAMVLVPDYFGSSSVVLGAIFFATQPVNLATHLKTHYSNSGKKGEPFIHGEWWVSDIVRWIYMGYNLAMVGICLGYYWSQEWLLQLGVFLINLTPLFACQSYRLLLSIPSKGLVYQQANDKKRN